MSAPAPTWLAWKVFHDGLAYYDQKSHADLQKMLNKEFGLSAAQTATLMNAGKSFNGAIQKIDDETTAEVKRRYGKPVQAGKSIMGSSGQPEKSPKERAKEDGLYGEVEAKKANAFTSHRAEILKSLGIFKLARITDFVNKSIAPNIREVDAKDAITKPVPGTPPGIPPHEAKAPGARR